MIKTTLKNCSEYIKTQHMRRYFVNRDSWMVDECNLPRLSKQEIEDANKMWPFCKVNERDLIWLRMYKKEYGFDPSFVTDYQLLLIFRKTNPYKQVVSLEHKAMFDIYYPEIPTPHNYIKVINGTCWYEGEVCSWDTALSQLSKTSVENVVVKPTTDTGCGKGVQITI